MKHSKSANEKIGLKPEWMWCLFWAVMLLFPKREYLLSVEDLVYGYSMQPSCPALIAGLCITLTEILFVVRHYWTMRLSTGAFIGLQLLTLMGAAVPSSAGFVTLNPFVVSLMLLCAVVFDRKDYRLLWASALWPLLEIGYMLTGDCDETLTAIFGRVSAGIMLALPVVLMKIGESAGNFETGEEKVQSPFRDRTAGYVGKLLCFLDGLIVLMLGYFCHKFFTPKGVASEMEGWINTMVLLVLPWLILLFFVAASLCRRKRTVNAFHLLLHRKYWLVLSALTLLAARPQVDEILEIGFSESCLVYFPLAPVSLTLAALSFYRRRDRFKTRTKWAAGIGLMLLAACFLQNMSLAPQKHYTNITAEILAWMLCWRCIFADAKSAADGAKEEKTWQNG